MVNPGDKFELVFKNLLEALFVERMDQNEEIFARFMNDRSFQKVVTGWLSTEAYRKLNSDSQAALQAGELNPADALTTELQAFDAEGSLISIQQRYLSSIAELGFRSGALIDAQHADQLRQGAEFWPWACP